MASGARHHSKPQKALFALLTISLLNCGAPAEAKRGGGSRGSGSSSSSSSGSWSSGSSSSGGGSSYSSGSSWLSGSGSNTHYYHHNNYGHSSSESMPTWVIVIQITLICLCLLYQCMASGNCCNTEDREDNPGGYQMQPLITTPQKPVWPKVYPPHPLLPAGSDPPKVYKKTSIASSLNLD